MIKEVYRTLTLTSESGEETLPWFVDEWNLEVPSLQLGKLIVDDIINSLDIGEKQSSI